MQLKLTSNISSCNSLTGEENDCLCDGVSCENSRSRIKVSLLEPFVCMFITNCSLRLASSLGFAQMRGLLMLYLFFGVWPFEVWVDIGKLCNLFHKFLLNFNMRSLVY